MFFVQVCAHFKYGRGYNYIRKNPQYILFLLSPIVEIPSPKKAAHEAVFFSTYKPDERYIPPAKTRGHV